MDELTFRTAYLKYLAEEMKITASLQDLRLAYEQYQDNPEDYTFLLDYLTPTGECAQ